MVCIYVYVYALCLAKVEGGDELDATRFGVLDGS